VSGLKEAGLFTRVVDDVREGSLTTAEIADITGVDERQVYNWASGASRPKGIKRDRLLELQFIIKELREVYTPEGADIWLHARNRALNKSRPIDLLVAGDFQSVLAAVEQLTSGST
jgi:Protein of unknown function (DUF2384)